MKNLKLTLNYLRHNLMAGMAYRGAFFIEVFGMLLNNVMLLFFWTILFAQFPAINGWTLRDVATIYGVLTVGYGLSVVVCGNGSRVAQLISNGDLDYYLTLPADPLTHLLISRMVMSGWGDILFGLLLSILVLPSWWLKLPLFLVLGTLSALIIVAFNIIVGSLAFWLGQSQNLAMQLRNALISFGTYPIDIFPGIVRTLLYTLIPSAFIGSVPATLLKNFNGLQFIQMVLFTAGALAIARIFFQTGLRRYESGNLVGSRG